MRALHTVIFLIAAGGLSSACSGESTEGAHSGDAAISSGGRINGAGGGASMGGAGAGGAPAAQFKEEWTHCQSDIDCVVVPSNSCCGCNPVGVHHDHEAEARAVFASFNPGACGALGCASPPCPLDPVPLCTAERCTWQEGCSARTQTDCATDGKCEPYDGRRCGSQVAPSYVACSKPKGTCDSALTCAIGPNTIEFMFPNGCVPEGWKPCPVACN